MEATVQLPNELTDLAEDQVILGVSPVILVAALSRRFPA